MAAYAALVSLMNIIHDIQHHHSPPISIHTQQSQSLTQSIASLQQFLETHNTSSLDEADPLEMRIADAAYAAEDIIESHIVNRILPQNIPFSEDATHNGDQTNIPYSEVSSHHRFNRIIKLFNCFRAHNDDQTNISFSEVASHHDDETKLYEDLQRVIDEMESIKKQTVEIDAEKEVVHHHQRLRPMDAFAASSKSYSTKQYSITVSSDDIINEVMEKLIWGESDCHVIPVVGMGGIGKTTLAKNIYEKPLIKEHFQIRAWATISQQYNAKEILCEVLCQTTNKEMKEELSGKSEDEIGTKLYQHLFGRRYLIVMDDMWTMDAWDRIQRFFPNNENGSRVLVTTRLSQLSSRLNESYCHHMKFLDESSSWDLFSKTVFGEETCPHELEGIGKKIVENCRGLPLSIVVVRGNLKKMEYTRRIWESIGKNLSSVVNLENDKHCLRLLRMSYNHLPAHLKPCFLYMGVFEEDDEIKVSTLIKQWVGEGFIKPINDDSLEAIGKGFLMDLVDRNLILVHQLGCTGNIKYCKVHDLLRDFCLSESKKDGFYHVIGQDSPRGMDRQRRVVIPNNTLEIKVLEDWRSMSNVRSVISGYEKVPLCKNFRLVRVLSSEKYFGKKNVELDAFKYVNLRHLDASVDGMSSFFSPITLHRNLHALIVAYPRNSTAPLEIWKMSQFRRIEFISMPLFLSDPPKDGVVMENLHTLTGVENFKFGEGAVEKIPNMKKLGMWYSGYEGYAHEDFYCLSNIQHLCYLEYLRVTLWFDFERVESLNMLAFQHSLKQLILYIGPKFEWDDMLKKVGSLPLLEKLKLRNKGGFRRGEWEIVEGQFPRLKYLGISSFYDLRKMTTKDESSVIFPSLQQLNLKGLKQLEEIPYEIGEIATLQKILIEVCGASVVKRAKEIVEEQMESQGDVLSFNVVVSLQMENEQLLSLAGPNFLVFA